MKSLKYTLMAFVLFWSMSINAQNYTVDTKKSNIEWKGKKVSGEHYGNIEIKKGSFTVEDNKITRGTFEVDMLTIDNVDLTSPERNKRLVDHLKSDDFFSVADYPVSTLVITSSTPFKNGEAEVKGNLTIKGETHPVTFVAKENGNGYTALLTIDRTKYNVRYGSGKYFDNLGDNMIYDDFTLDVNLVTQ